MYICGTTVIPPKNKLSDFFPLSMGQLWQRNFTTLLLCKAKVPSCLQRVMADLVPISEELMMQYQSTHPLCTECQDDGKAEQKGAAKSLARIALGHIIPDFWMLILCFLIWIFLLFLTIFMVKWQWSDWGVSNSSSKTKHLTYSLWCPHLTHYITGQSLDWLGTGIHPCTLNIRSITLEQSISSVNFSFCAYITLQYLLCKRNMVIS